MCDEECKFYKMFQSYREKECWPDAQGRLMATLYCVDCELKKRIDEWSSWTGPQKEIAGEDYATKKRVVKDQKNRAREGGQQGVKRFTMPRSA